jgi:hypothetical protein
MRVANLPRACSFGPAIAFAFVLALAPKLAVSQVRRVSDLVSCPRCEILLERVATLGDTVGPGRIGTVPSLVRDRRGRWYLTQEGTSAKVTVFDSGGRFLQTIGREGKGPGEFLAPMHAAVGPGDTLYVVDANFRVSVFSPSYQLMRSAPSKVYFRRINMGYGRWITTGSLATPQSYGLPMQLIDDTGRIVKAFGANPPLNMKTQETRLCVGAGRTPGQVWSSPIGRYYIELWDTAGRRHGAYERSVTWFPPHKTPNRGPYPVTIQTMREDSRGRLWVAITLPADSATAVTDPRWERGRVEASAYATQFEVIDVRTGRLIASKRFPIEVRNTSRFVGDLLYVLREDDRTGYSFIDIWRVTLSDPPKEINAKEKK